MSTAAVLSLLPPPPPQTTTTTTTIKTNHENSNDNNSNSNNSNNDYENDDKNNNLVMSNEQQQEQEQQQEEIEISANKNNNNNSNNHHHQQQQYSNNNDVDDRDDDKDTSMTVMGLSNHRNDDNYYKGGLVNLGNTCYLNSALQMLFSIDLFVSMLIQQYCYHNNKNDDYDDDDDIENNNNNNNNSMTIKEKELHYPLHHALAQLFQSMKSNDDDDENNNNHQNNIQNETTTTYYSNDEGEKVNDHHSNDHTNDTITNNNNNNGDENIDNSVHTITTSSINNNMNSNNNNYNNNNNNNHHHLIQNLKNVIDRLTPQFIGYFQQDSHEFLSTLIDLLHDENMNVEKEKRRRRGRRQQQEQRPINDVKDLQQKPKQDQNYEKIEFSRQETIEQQQQQQHDYNIIDSEDITICEEMDITTWSTNDKHSSSINGEGYVLVNKPSVSILSQSSSPISTNIGTSNTHQQQSNKKARFTMEDRIDDNGSSQNNDTIMDSCESILNEKDYVKVMNTESYDCEKEDKTQKNRQPRQREKQQVKTCPASSYDIPKVPSFSQLKLDEIGLLLHGEQSIDENVHCKSQSTNLQNHDYDIAQKLIGGRIDSSTADFSLQLDVNDTNVNDGLSQYLPQEHDTQQESISSEENNDETSSRPHPNLTMTDEVSSNNNNDDDSSTSCNIASLVDTFFTMEIRTCLTCDSCSFSRSRQETFRHLSIDIGSDTENEENSKQDSTSLLTTISSLPQSIYERRVQEGLRKFFSSEKVELKCEKCFFGSATQTKEITRLPHVLLLHLKRFVVDMSPDYTTVSYRKNRSAVEFGECLSLDMEDSERGVLGEFLATDVSSPIIPDIDHVSSDDIIDDEDNDYDMIQDDTSNDEDFIDLGLMQRKYNIRSVVNHIGSSANCGHYTANVLKLVRKDESGVDDIDDKNREWFKFNDDFVSKMSQGDALSEQSQRSAYMILYELE